eukprot:TRINITY_DN10935_c0_g1_i2.p1 TRINITY_DN10935_c0_g1~~TRINITY_DN10935_c0_g1_i2.p1  ORF type:complete len:452 (-),score=118.69 TRINITY_DN10935_c0_g1_i2:78-1433(-)
MGLCSGKLGGGGDCVDILETTAWIRGVVTGHQAKRKGLSKFCKFSFEPLGSRCNDEESSHQISVGFLDGKGQPREVNWIIGVSQIKNPSASHGPFNAECQARKSFLPDLSSFLRNSSYKRAIFLVNIPDLIYLEEKTYPTGKRFHLVVENIFITKKCRQLSPSFLQAGLDLTHLNVALATLAQFHAASLAWKQSLQDDSVLDVYPFLSKPPCPMMSAQERQDLLLKYKMVLTKLHNNQLPERLALKLDYLELVNKKLSEPDEKDISHVLATVGLGAVSPLDLAFHYPFAPSVNQNEGSTSAPACAAVTQIGSIAFSTLMRDLACWVFILSNRSIRRYYLMDVISNYLIVLTNALDILGVNWEMFGINFNNFCDLFYKEVEVGLLVSVLVAMKDTSKDELDEYLNNVESVDENMTSEVKSETIEEHKSITISLSKQRLEFLLHLLDDVHKFV